jgi:hypothetical protein
VTSIGAMAKGGAVKTAAVGIDGADSNGKANDKEMRGDAAAVAQRRGAALRRRAAHACESLQSYCVTEKISVRTMDGGKQAQSRCPVISFYR